MIQEDYVSFELAKLLKDKGFNAMCEHYFSENLDGSISCHTAVGHWNAVMNFIARPSLSLAMKWLREEHKLFIDISFQKDEDDSVTWFYMTWALDNRRRDVEEVDFTSYEEAVEAALKYVLEKLI